MKSSTVYFPLYSQARLTLPPGVILHLSYTFSLTLHWWACLCATGSWLNNYWEMTLQSAPKSNLKFTIASAILSNTCQSSWEGQSHLTSIKMSADQRCYHCLLIQPWHAPFSLSNPAFSFTKHLRNGLSSGSSHTFCQKQDKISRSEKNHKNYTSLIADPNLIPVDAAGDVSPQWMFQSIEQRGHHMWSGYKVQSTWSCTVHAWGHAQLPSMKKGELLIQSLRAVLPFHRLTVFDLHIGVLVEWMRWQLHLQAAFQK